MLTSIVCSFCMQVNGKAGGKTALHCAIAGGHLSIVKNILEFNPDLEMGVNYYKVLICF